MCKKTVFHNSYTDGQHDISERVESCSPGYICPDPLVVEYDRIYDCPRDQAKRSQARDDLLASSVVSPSPSRSVSPASVSAIDNTNNRRRHHHHHHISEVYVNGHKIPSTAASAATSATATTATAATTSATTAPASPASASHTMAQPIPIRRSATMTYGGMEPGPERGRRPIIVEPMLPLRTSPRPAPGSSHYPLGPSPMPRTTAVRPVDIFQHTTVPSSPRRRTPVRDLRDMAYRDFRDFRDARDLRAEYRTDYRGEFRSPTRAERPFSLRTSDRDPATATTTTTIPASSINRRNSVSTGSRDFLMPHHYHHHTVRPRADSSPMGYGSAEDEAELAERRRRRRKLSRQATVTRSSVPTFGNANTHTHSHSHTHSRSRSHSGSGLDSGFASSYESSGYTTASTAGSSFTSPTPSSASASASAPAPGTSPATAAVKKNLRWQDEERRRQNERISNRPKLSRDDTITPANAKLQGEVKSILKPTTPGGSPRERSRSQSRPRVAGLSRDVRDARDHDDLAGGVSGLNIRGNSPPPSPRDEESEAQRARLRDRFDKPSRPGMPPRRYTAGSSHRRRTEIWPPRAEDGF